MGESSAHIAVDLGAESGRVVLGVLEKDRVRTYECHRFGHDPVHAAAVLHWDLARIWSEVKKGLSLAADRALELGVGVRSVGVDSWGVDYAVLQPGGELAGPPRCYRDPAFAEEFERVKGRLGADYLYGQTGIQLLPFNTLYQYAERFRSDPGSYGPGSRLLLVPDVIHWKLSGKATNEITNASTSQMMCVGGRAGSHGSAWNRELIGKLGLPCETLLEPLHPGTSLGVILPGVADETGLAPTTRVILPPTHDTAAAIAAVPRETGSRWCFLSSGTWSLLGAELEAPHTSDEARVANFTNELGVDGTVRFLKNISGLWLVQQVRAEYEQDGGSVDYAALTAMAEAARPFRTLFPVDLPAITGAKRVAGAIRTFAEQTRQPVPESPGELVRACLESLALQYAESLDELERLLGAGFDALHVVGGGSRNQLLNQMTADATGRRVMAGPAEASALGNVLVQAMGAGTVRDLSHLREIVRASEKPEVFLPVERESIPDVRDRYRAMLRR